MADNTRGGSQDTNDPLIASDEVTYSGETADVQLVRVVGVSGAEGSRTVDALSDIDGLLISRAKNLITEVTGSGSALNATPIASTDCTHTPYVSVQLTGTWNAIVSFEVSNDNTNWVATYATQVSQGPLTSIAQINDIYAGPIHGKYFRARISSYTSGTVNARAEFFSRPVQHTDNDARIVLSQSYPGSVYTPGADSVASIIQTFDSSGSAEAPVAAAGYIFNDTTDAWDRTRSIGGLAPSDSSTGILAVARVPHKTGYTPLGINFTATTTQTSTNLIAGTGGQRVYVTHLTIATGGTTAGRVSVYWGTGAFTAGTSQTLFDGEFVPSATTKPGVVLTFAVPPGGASATGDNLRITTSAGITIYVTGQAYKS